MLCPKDGTELTHAKVGDIELDKCHQCDGIWCDRGELERLRESGIAEVETDLEAKYGNPATVQGDRKRYMRCPRCEEARLQGISISLHAPIRVDRCEDCLGIWLDNRELDIVLSPNKKKEVAEPETKSNKPSSGLRSFLAKLGGLKN